VTWTFLWLMLGLKIPIAALIYIVWWAVKDPPKPVPAPDDRGGDGNDRIGLERRHPRKPLPRHPRRGPHGGLAAAPPPRMRTTRTRTRTFEHGE
jgi:hypothetical protein